MRRSKEYDQVLDILTSAGEHVSVYINNINPEAQTYQIVVHEYPYSIRILRTMNAITERIEYTVYLRGSSNNYDLEFIVPHRSWIPEQYFQQSTLHEIPFEQYELDALVQYMEAKVTHSETHSTIGKPIFGDFLLQSLKEFT